MKQEDKKLLLKDLCARLPYGAIVQLPEIFSSELIDVELDSIVKMKDGLFHFTDDFGYCIEHIKPYLRPMSSMTAEEIWEIDNMQTGGDFDLPNGEGFTWLPNPDICDYLNSIHVDYRGLIDKGLAIAVTQENNPYKQ